ncbi:hypothetical protein AAFF_G00430350 [Aldrovandia affinis]|uniref:Uncharacterized protein n=1 Tax=Aldrovandia affinis TaxID=143900 RepID=A0AAD7S8X6_9TELE|nr:hypothetical protein AAFF_G00430350 [Aldrovandia affinis]
MTKPGLPKANCELPSFSPRSWPSATTFRGEPPHPFPLPMAPAPHPKAVMVKSGAFGLTLWVFCATVLRSRRRPTPGCAKGAEPKRRLSFHGHASVGLFFIYHSTKMPEFVFPYTD